MRISKGGDVKSIHSHGNLLMNFSRCENMAFQVKVEYGEKRFATFLLENVSYDGLVSSIRKNCSSLAHLDADKIRLRYRDEDGDMVNICEADHFAFSEMLRTAKEVKDRDYKKIFIQANEIDSPCPRKIK